MAYQCQICGKKSVVGRISRHKRGVAGRRWAKRAPKIAKVFRPNLQYKVVNGRKMRLCTKCLKRLKKDGKVVFGKPAKKKEKEVLAKERVSQQPLAAPTA